MSPSVVSRKIVLKRVAHVYFTYVDLDQANAFLLDFGFRITEKRSDEIYYRGYGTEPFIYCAKRGIENAFDGAAFVVETLEDLEIAHEKLPGATDIYNLKTPGGGKCVTFYDPVDNFPFHLVYGQTPVEMASTFPELDFNFPTSKYRAVGKFQRFQKGPAPIHKLGHFGLCVTNYKKTFSFFTSNFNFKPSDIVYDEEGTDITTFLHLDRGDEMVDHHTFFFFEGPKPHLHHTSYEVHDFDRQLLGHDWLIQKKYENCWGVGRHVMGSQIFDYWFDPSRFIIEHYVDGDLVNDKTPTNRSKAAPDNLHVWGPDLPPTFLL